MTASSFIQKGVNAATQGNLTEAENCFRQAFLMAKKKSQEERNSLANLIKALAEQRKSMQITKLLENTEDLLICKLPPMPLLIAAEAASNQSNIELGLKLYNILNLRYPNQKEVVIGMSSTLIRAGQLGEAEKLLATFTATGRFDTEIVSNIAIVASEQGKNNKAEENYRLAQKLQPSIFATNYNLGKFLQAHGSLNESLEYYNQCLAISPQAIEVQIEKADILNRLGREVEATTIYESLISSNNIKKNQKNHATRQYLYTMIDKRSDQLTAEKLSSLLKSIPLDNETLSLVYDLSRDQQKTCGGIELYQPRTLIKEIQYVDSNDKILELLGVEIIQNPSLLHDRPNKPTRGGQQTHELLLDPSPSIKQIYKKIQAILIDYGNQLPERIRLDNTKNYILSGWAVCLKSGGYQLRHTHPEALISAVFYIKIPDEIKDLASDGGSLFFSKRRADQQIDAIKIKPTPGKLVIFPSYLPHETTAFESKSKRICIACNLIKVN